MRRRGHHHGVRGRREGHEVSSDIRHRSAGESGGEESMLRSRSVCAFGMRGTIALIGLMHPTLSRSPFLTSFSPLIGHRMSCLGIAFESA